MAKRPGKMAKRWQKDPERYLKDRRDGKKTQTIFKRLQKDVKIGISRQKDPKRQQKDPENGKGMTERPRIIGKSRPEIWQKDAE